MNPKSSYILKHKCEMQTPQWNKKERESIYKPWGVFPPLIEWNKIKGKRSGRARHVPRSVSASVQHRLCPKCTLAISGDREVRAIKTVQVIRSRDKMSIEIQGQRSSRGNRGAGKGGGVSRWKAIVQFPQQFLVLHREPLIGFGFFLQRLLKHRLLRG